MVNSPRSGDSARSCSVNEFLSHIFTTVEGSYEILKEMRSKFSSLNNKLNCYSDVIKQLENQMSQLTFQVGTHGFVRKYCFCLVVKNFLRFPSRVLIWDFKSLCT